MSYRPERVRKAVVNDDVPAIQRFASAGGRATGELRRAESEKRKAVAQERSEERAILDEIAQEEAILGSEQMRRSANENIVPLNADE